jgi:DNA-binding response OmpR family regulator
MVDDDVDLCIMMEFYFNNLGYQVYIARRASAALQIAFEKQPSLILLDIGLPDGDGYSVARTLRADARTDGIPIIILSARTERDDRLLGLEVGADDYVEKPFDVQMLRLKIEQLLKRPG